MKENTKSEKIHSFATKFIIVLCALSFALFSMFAPSAFAQQKNSEKKKSSANTQQYMQLINSIFGFVMQNYVDEVDPEVLYEGALKGMMDSLDDPYTQYLDQSSMRGLTDTTVGEFGGVGLSISKPLTSTPEKPAYVEVASPIEGGPGYKAGIQAGDFIIKINETSTPDITMDEVLKMLRGKVGETVNVTIKRGKNMIFEVALKREIIEVPTVKFGTINRNNQKIGYIKIIEFTPLTPEKVQQALDSFDINKSNYDGIVIDLRNNPGGLITSVRDVADKFIDEGTIVYTKNRKGEIDSLFSASKQNTTVNQDIPIIVLINKGSASASEILSGALKDHKRAYLMGERSYGKGSVQQLFPLYNSDGVKITIARYYTPSDVNIDKIGIPPDREVKNLEEFTPEQEKAYLEMLDSDIIAKTVEANPNMKEAEISSEATKIAAKYGIETRLIRRLLRNQVNKKRGTPLYDLDFDEPSKKLDITEDSFINAYLYDEPEELLNKKRIFKVIYHKKDNEYLSEEDIYDFSKKERAKVKKRRYFYRDNILQKIKRNFFNVYIIKHLNNVLKKEESNIFFDLFPQSFVNNVSKELNNQILNMTLKDIFEIKDLYKGKKINKYYYNLNVINSIKNKNSKINDLLEKTYIEHYKEYLNSDEYKIKINEINEHYKEDEKYIIKYKAISKHYIELFS